MSKPFFITGLPRSRTAWLANLFTTDQTFCWHDRLFSKALLDNPRRVGFSGPELVKQFNDIASLFPEAPWLVVLRNTEHARAAEWSVSGEILTETATNYGMSKIDLQNLLDREWKERVHLLAGVCSHARTLVVNFNEMDEEPMAKEMWRHLLPDIGFDVERWKLLCEFNVQQIFNKVFADRIKLWPS